MVGLGLGALRDVHSRPKEAGIGEEAAVERDGFELVWTANTQNILDKIACGRVALNQATNSGTQH